MVNAATTTPAPEEGAVYCRVAHRRSTEQFGVDQREAACRTLAADLGLRVAARHVFIDPRTAAWSRDGLRPTWQGMLTAARTGAVGALVLFDAPELLRHHPWDLAEVLVLAEQRGLTLLDPTGVWELNEAAHRRALVERTAQECRRREASAERRQSRNTEESGTGRPHGGGLRAYGYAAGTYDLIPYEGSVVEQIFTWFVEGSTFTGIATSLNRLGVTTAYGSSWSASGVRRIIDAPRYAGLRVVRGEVARAADGSYVLARWKPCVAPELWETAQALRRARAEKWGPAAQLRGESRHYPLTGLVECALCGYGMVGSMVEGFATYACAGGNPSGTGRCSLHVSGERLEDLVDLRVVRMLERLGPRSPERTPASAVLDGHTMRLRAEDQARLARLRAMTPPPGEEVAALTARIREVNRAVVVRAGDALDGLVTGRRASAEWKRISLTRRAEVRRFLIARIRVGAVVGPRSVFDPGRVEIVPNPW